MIKVNLKCITLGTSSSLNSLLKNFIVLFTIYWRDGSAKFKGAIISHSLYIFNPIFHCGLQSRVVINANNLRSKQGNSVRIKLAKVFIYEPIENIIFTKSKITREEKIAFNDNLSKKHAKAKQGFTLDL